MKHKYIYILSNTLLNGASSFSFAPPRVLASQDTHFSVKRGPSGDHPLEERNWQDPRKTMLYKATKFIQDITGGKQQVRDEDHTFLSGNFAPVSEEHAGVPLKVVEGALPSNLDGLYVRNGPNPIPEHQDSRRKYSWIDGHGMLHAVRMKEGQAVYSNSYIPTPRYETEQAMGEEFFIRHGEYAAASEGGLFSFLRGRLLESVFVKAAGLKDYRGESCNNSVMMFRDKFYCLHEASVPFAVQLNDDGSIVQGSGRFDNFGQGDAPIGAHSQVDSQSGNLLTHTWCHAGPMTVGEIEAAPISKEEEVQDTETLRLKDLSPKSVPLIHDTIFTDNFKVIFDGSQRIDPARMAESGESLYQWSDKHTLRIGLAPRFKRGPVREEDSDVLWFDTGVPLFILHAMNAWEEEDGTIVIWAPTTSYFSFNTFLQSENSGPSSDPFHMTEFRIHPKDLIRFVHRKVVCEEHSVDSPHVVPGGKGRRTSVGFAGIQNRQNDSLRGTFNGIVVYDMAEGKSTITIQFPRGEVGGEIAVIPKPGKSGDGEVYLGLYTHDTKTNQSFYVLYDGETGALVCRLGLPYRVPFGFHGTYIDAKTLERHVAN